jgi:hypothetical protein
MTRILVFLTLGLTLSMVTPVVAQTAPAPASPAVSPDAKAAIAAELGKILNDTQKSQLQAGLAAGKKLPEILPTLDLSNSQKQQVMKLLRTHRPPV